MSKEDVKTVYALGITGVDYGEECAGKQSAKGYEYRISDEYDWHADTFSQEFLYTLEKGPLEEEELITGYFAYKSQGEVPYKVLKDHLDFLVKEGHVVIHKEVK